jgi:hypothetical protein
MHSRTLLASLYSAIRTALCMCFCDCVGFLPDVPLLLRTSIGRTASGLTPIEEFVPERNGCASLPVMASACGTAVFLS